MFTEIAELAELSDIELSISLVKDGEMRVLFKPVAKLNMNASLFAPIALTATPQELDNQFATVIMAYQAKRKSVEESISDSLAFMEAISKAKSEDSATVKNVSKPVAPVAKHETTIASQDEDFGYDDDLFA